MKKFLLAATVTILGFLAISGLNNLANAQEEMKAPPVEERTAQSDSKDEVRFVIKDDMGGSVLEFQQAIRYLKKNNMKIKVDGRCVSACTLLLDKEVGLDICVTPKATFEFHHPFLVGMGAIVYSVPAVVLADQIWKTEFVGKYPDWANKIIDERGGAPNVYTGAKPSDLLVIGIPDLAKYMKVCNS